MNTSFDIANFSQRTVEAFGENPWMGVLYVVGSLAGVAGFLSLLGMVLIYTERKVAAHFQCRLGPMRVGWHGMLQSVADALKLLFKEDIIPERADRILFYLAPVFSIIATVLTLVLIPITPTLQVIDLNIGVIFIAAVSGFGALGVLLGGWSSNNKWSLLGQCAPGLSLFRMRSLLRSHCWSQCYYPDHSSYQTLYSRRLTAGGSGARTLSV